MKNLSLFFNPFVKLNEKIALILGIVNAIVLPSPYKPRTIKSTVANRL